MKIKKITKKRNNNYELLFDDLTKINIYDDTLINYNLLSNKDVDNMLLVEITNYNNSLEGYYTAIKLINTKLRTKLEIANKLTKLGYTNVSSIVDRLVKEGYLNDSIYIISYINDAINLSLKGPNKIKYELEKMKLPIDTIEEYLNGFDSNLWEDKIDKIISKKIKSNHNLSNTIFKKKLKEYLITMGYDIQLANIKIDSLVLESDKEILKKELDKETKKLSKKYDGDILNTKVKYNLYKKGFNVSDIELLMH